MKRKQTRVNLGEYVIPWCYTSRLKFLKAFIIKALDRVGFEPTIPLRVRLISSQVPSTTQPPVLMMNPLLTPPAQNNKAKNISPF